MRDFLMLPAHRSRLVAEFVRCLEGEIEIEYCFTLTQLAHMVREVLDSKDVQASTPAAKRSLGSSA
jgi:hypothetical protein